jgi:RNA polymerase sigma-70 factor (ECF subfamily)
MEEQDWVGHFERLHAATYPALVAYAVRRCDSSTQAADAVAETYLVLWRRLGDAPEEVLPWLYGVARKVIANQRRGQQRESALSARLAEELASLPDAHAPEPPQGPALRRAFAALNDQDRELLALLVWEDLDRDQVALSLGISRATARVRIHRARQRFARALLQEGVEVPHSAPKPSTASLNRPLSQETSP